MELEPRIKHLYQCANALLPDSHTAQVLKSYYINTARKIAKWRVALPESHFGPSVMCSRCGSQWQESTFKMHSTPAHVTSSKARASRLISKLDAPRDQLTPMLTKSQRKRAKWLRKRVLSNVEVVCSFCNHQTRFALQKPKKKMMTSVSEAEVVGVQSTPATKKRKKKKNKKAKIQNLDDSNIEIKTDAKHSNDIALPVPAAPKADEMSTPKLKAQAASTPKSKTQATPPTLSKGAKPQSSQGKGAIAKVPSQTPSKSKKKGKNNGKPAPAGSQKNQSKTQKQNSLVQLASLLKNQATKTANQANRLNALLRS